MTIQTHTFEGDPAFQVITTGVAFDTGPEDSLVLETGDGEHPVDKLTVRRIKFENDGQLLIHTVPGRWVNVIVDEITVKGTAWIGMPGVSDHIAEETP